MHFGTCGNICYYRILFHLFYWMARDTNLRQLRDQSIKERFRFHRKRNPKWMITAVIAEVSREFYLSDATVGKILKSSGEKVPCVDTIVKYANA